MALLSAIKFYSFTKNMAQGVYNFDVSETIKVALSNVEPTVATDTDFTDITEISAGDGYTAGGEALTVSSAAQSGGLFSFVTSGTITWTSTGTIGPFQYVPIYDDDATNDELMFYYDIGTEVTLNNTDTYSIDFGVTLFEF